MTKNDLEKQAKKIIKMAQESGVQSNYLFITTFDRYRTQLNILDQLKEKISDEDVLVSKEYVKGSKNLYTNPAITEYNKTTDSANKTASTLIRIIKSFNVEESETVDDPLMNILNGVDEDGR